VGVPLARLLAAKGHDLVLGNAPEGLAEELGSLGAAVEVVPDVQNLNKPESSARLVAAALQRFGRIDAATMFSGRIVTGPFLTSTPEHLAAAVRGCIEAPYHFLRAVVPVMAEQRDGQVLVLTSAAGAKPTPNARCTRRPARARRCW
jgi:3-oxoacyl-[acyl-carrier protein] reductase